MSPCFFCRKRICKIYHLNFINANAVANSIASLTCDASVPWNWYFIKKKKKPVWHQVNHMTRKKCCRKASRVSESRLFLTQGRYQLTQPTKVKAFPGLFLLFFSFLLLLWIMLEIQTILQIFLQTTNMVSDYW